MSKEAKATCYLLLLLEWSLDDTDTPWIQVVSMDLFSEPSPTLARVRSQLWATIHEVSAPEYHLARAKMLEWVRHRENAWMIPWLVLRNPDLRIKSAWEDPRI